LLCNDFTGWESEEDMERIRKGGIKKAGKRTSAIRERRFFFNGHWVRISLPLDRKRMGMELTLYAHPFLQC
jgi:hypothetical protein